MGALETKPSEVTSDLTYVSSAFWKCSAKPRVIALIGIDLYYISSSRRLVGESLAIFPITSGIWACGYMSSNLQTGGADGGGTFAAGSDRAMGGEAIDIPEDPDAFRPSDGRLIRDQPHPPGKCATAVVIFVITR